MLATRLPRGFTAIRILAIGLCLILSAPALADDLHDAVRDGDIARITALLDAGADIEARGEGGLTPLYYAAGNGHADAITVLLDAGADIDDARNKFGFTPLHAAAFSGHGTAVTALLDAGADPSLQDETGSLPIDRIEEDSPIYKSSAWWQLNDARFNNQ